jgi:hypothetical protein
MSRKMLAIAPLHRADWLLENALVVVAILVLVATRNVLPLSRMRLTAATLPVNGRKASKSTM